MGRRQRQYKARREEAHNKSEQNKPHLVLDLDGTFVACTRYSPAFAAELGSRLDSLPSSGHNFVTDSFEDFPILIGGDHTYPYFLRFRRYTFAFLTLLSHRYQLHIVIHGSQSYGEDIGQFMTARTGCRFKHVIGTKSIARPPKKLPPSVLSAWILEDNPSVWPQHLQSSIIRVKKFTEETANDDSNQLLLALLRIVGVRMDEIVKALELPVVRKLVMDYMSPAGFVESWAIGAGIKSAEALESLSMPAITHTLCDVGCCVRRQAGPCRKSLAKRPATADLLLQYSRRQVKSAESKAKPKGEATAERKVTTVESKATPPASRATVTPTAAQSETRASGQLARDRQALVEHHPACPGC